MMALQVIPVENTPSDRLGIATAIVSAYFEKDTYYRTIYPNSSQSELITNTGLRLGHTLIAPGKWHLKVLDPSTGQLVSYSRWTLPHSVLQKLYKENPIPKPTMEELVQYEKDYELGCEDGEPKGLNVKMTDVAGRGFSEARKLMPSQEHICQ
jgi:hypothetical protein